MKTSSRTQPKSVTRNAKQKAVSNVRIIGGHLKRRNVSFIDADGLRPTPDRLRETLFNWLLADIHGARVLDSCAGSGVLGFEALSRGAAHCTFIEINQHQNQILQQTAAQLTIPDTHYQMIHGAAEQALNKIAQAQSMQPFDIVFIDPPYAQDLWQPILTALITHHLVTADTLLYIEADKNLDDQLTNLALIIDTARNMPALSRFDCVKQTKVGQVVAGLYRFTSS